MPKVRVLMTGGGTGGHIYPLIAVATELQIIAGEKRSEIDIRYLGAYGPFKELLQINGIKAGRIAESKLRRYFSVLNFIDGPKFAYSILQAVFKMFRFMPDVVFSKGGPGALAVVLAARFYRIPVVIHESDSVPGLTNFLSSKFAKIIAISFESAAAYFPDKKVMLTGNPVRRELILSQEHETMFKNKGFLGFDPSLSLITIIGGSQGAAVFNDFVLQNLSKLLEFTQVIHQTGMANYDHVLGKIEVLIGNIDEEIAKRYRVVSYFKEDLGPAYISSDLVVSRASAGSIFELATFGKPSILIPLPPEVSAGDHQTENAKDYSKSGAAILIDQKELSSKLIVEIKNLLNDPKSLDRMGKAAHNFCKPNAAYDMANIILNVATSVVN